MGDFDRHAARQSGEISGRQTGSGWGDLVHTYIKIDSNNVVTAVIPHSEMGQGVHTALGQMLAEMDADWEQVQVEEAPAIGDSHTAGRRYLIAMSIFPILSSRQRNDDERR